GGAQLRRRPLGRRDALRGGGPRPALRDRSALPGRRRRDGRPRGVGARVRLAGPGRPHPLRRARGPAGPPRRARLVDRAARRRPRLPLDPHARFLALRRRDHGRPVARALRLGPVRPAVRRRRGDDGRVRVRRPAARPGARALRGRALARGILRRPVLFEAVLRDV
ncbi:MAG: hypothetical protein AVDCRST_MAG30-1560, partial [uncultured Solirubrobacteraceae bacterium]